MDPLTFAGGLTAAQRARLRSLVYRPGRDADEVEAMALGALADLDSLSKLARQAAATLGPAHPVAREILTMLDRRETPDAVALPSS